MLLKFYMKFFIKVSLGNLGVFLLPDHFSAHLCSYRSILSYFCSVIFLAWHILLLYIIHPRYLKEVGLGEQW